MHLPYAPFSERHFSDVLLVVGALKLNFVCDLTTKSNLSLYFTKSISMRHLIERDKRTLLPDTVVSFENWGVCDSGHCTSMGEAMFSLCATQPPLDAGCAWLNVRDKMFQRE